MSISYDKVACIKQDVAEVVRGKVQDNGDVFILSCITPFKNVFFAINSTDLQIGMPDGQRQLHGTAIAIFQEGEAEVQQQKMKLKRSSRLRKKSDQTPLYSPLFCPEPKKKVEYFSCTSDTSTLDVFRKHDIVWGMMKSQLDLAKFVPTWAAYNSLLTDIFQATTEFNTFINGSPTDWSNFYTALKIVQNINITCTPQKKTTASLDIPNAFSYSQRRK